MTVHLVRLAAGPVYVQCRLEGLPTGAVVPLALKPEDVEALEEALTDTEIVWEARDRAVEERDEAQAVRDDLARDLVRALQERDEARLSAQNARHAQRLNEAALSAKLREACDERDKALADLASARIVLALNETGDDRG